MVGVKSISIVGIDMQDRTERFTFGPPNCMDGMIFWWSHSCVFALAKVYYMLLARWWPVRKRPRNAIGFVKGLRGPEVKENRRGPVGRARCFGSSLGCFHGAGGHHWLVIWATAWKKRLAKKVADTFGTGNIRRRGAPEARQQRGAAPTGLLMPCSQTFGVPGFGYPRRS